MTMSTVPDPDEVTQLRAACALLGSHAAVVVAQHRNMAATLLGLAGRLRTLGFGALPVAAAPPPAPAPPPRAEGPGPEGLSVAQMLAEIQPDVVYARRRDEVAARARGTRGPGAEAAPPAAESLKPEDVYAARRAVAAGRR
jgi:hypothetical protein